MFKTNSKFKKIWRITRIFLAVIVTLYVIVIIYRAPIVIEKEKTEKIIAKIHATKLTMNDVLGENLPPDPGDEADKTVAGVDANTNGIRDDVELAIFKQYPNSAKMRAQLLQYALSLQITATLPFVNEKIATAWAQENDRAYLCVSSTLSRQNLEEYLEKLKEIDRLRDYIEEKQFNTLERQKAKKDFYRKIRSYGTAPGKKCDIDLSLLPN